jgi:hypothetical protein
MKEELIQKVEAFLETQTAKDVKLLLAYIVLKSETTTDDEIVDNIDDVIEILSESLKEISEVTVTDKEALDAAIRIAKQIAKLTKTKLDDIAVSIVDKVI